MAGVDRDAGSGPRQSSLARLDEFDIRPKRALGQNFLIDDNIVRLILDRLDARETDVVVEVGGGLGVLTEALARQVGHVHTFEVDRSLEAPLRRTIEGLDGVSLHLEDVMESRLESLQPEPTLCASNLPYSVAAPFLAEAVWRMPRVRRYVVMTQREVAERLTAKPGSRAYAGVSVWVQLHLDVRESRPLSREIYHPRPNVDSSLLTMERRPVEPVVREHPREVRRVIDAAFHQRRKAVVNSLAAGLSWDKPDAGAVLERAGIDPGLRAEALSPAAYVRLAREVLASQAASA